MNIAQLSGTFDAPPVEIPGYKNVICFMLKTRFPTGSGKPINVSIPCKVFKPTSEQREILLGKNHGNYRAEITGRIAATTNDGDDGHNQFSLQVLTLPNGLLLQRAR